MLNIIKRNAIRHYGMKGGVPVWNPSLGAYFILRRIIRINAYDDVPSFRFDTPTPVDAARMVKASKRKPQPFAFCRMILGNLNSYHHEARA